MPRILITGSREWPVTEIPVIAQVLGDAVLKFIERGVPRHKIIIVHGACPKGADAMVDWIATAWQLSIERHPADWHQYGKRAGFIRNTNMVGSGVDVCLAFVYNKSKGASMTVRLCTQQKIPVVLVER